MQLESAEKGRPEKESEREERNTTNKLLERKQEENKSDEPTDYKTNKSVDPLDKITNKMTGKNQVEAKIPEKSKSKGFWVFILTVLYYRWQRSRRIYEKYKRFHRWIN